MNLYCMNETIKILIYIVKKTEKNYKYESSKDIEQYLHHSFIRHL
jgi:hypothetical protein